MSFFRNIIRRLSGDAESADAGGGGAGAAGQGPAVRLALFGKHPAWDDHLDDIGLDTDRLVAAKRTFYLNGVGANLDAGTWNGLAGDQRLAGFDHLFLWRAGPSVVIARVVASTDGKGRARYPLVVCAQCVGLTPDRIATDVAPVLEDCLARCRQAADQDAVRAAHTDAQRRLQQIAARPAAQPTAAPPGLGDLARCPDLGPGGDKLHLVLFQVEREMAAFLPATGNTGTVIRGSAAAHLRVPACAADPAHAARLWLDLLVTLLDPAVPVLAIAAVGQGWVDLIVGNPRPPDFFCLLAGRPVLPFTTDIPFNMDPAFVARAARWVDDLGGTTEPAPGEQQPDAEACPG